MEEGETEEDFISVLRELIIDTVDIFKAVVSKGLLAMVHEEAEVEALMEEVEDVLSVGYFANVIGMFENIGYALPHPLLKVCEELQYWPRKKQQVQIEKLMPSRKNTVGYVIHSK